MSHNYIPRHQFAELTLLLGKWNERITHSQLTESLCLLMGIVLTKNHHDLIKFLSLLVIVHLVEILGKLFHTCSTMCV